MGLCQKDHHLNFCNSPILAIKNLKVKWVEKIRHQQKKFERENHGKKIFECDTRAFARIVKFKSGEFRI